VNRYDLVIVGAGPAGSSAALTASSRGLKTLIVEKQREVGRNILCAEGVSSNFLNLVKPKKGVATIIYRAGLIFENGESIFIEKEDGIGAVLERKIFDRHIFERAVEQGVEPLVGTSMVDIQKDGKYYKIKLEGKNGKMSVYAENIIGADGPASRVALLSGIENPPKIVHYCSQVYLYHPEIDGKTILFYFGNNLAPGGYAWAFPKDDGYANVGVGTTDPGDASWNYLAKFLDKYYKGAKILGFLRGTVPSGGLDLEFQKDRVFLTGDAARFADPLSGGGIANAFISGDIASLAIVEDKPEEYREKINNILEKDYRLSLLARQIIYSMDDRELNILAQELKRVFHGKNLTEIKSFNLVKMIFSTSPALWGLIIKKGGLNIAKTIQKIVSRRQ